MAVEPVPETFALLKRNLALNDVANVRALNKACWDSRRDLELWVPRGYYGIASAFMVGTGTSISVKACPLDDLTKDFPSIRLLKIDAEGAELPILRGAGETLRKTQSAVLEVGRDEKPILDVLRDCGFQIRSMEERTYFLADRPEFAP